MEVERLSGVVQKGWGYELIWATNDKYCGKIMIQKLLHCMSKN